MPAHFGTDSISVCIALEHLWTFDFSEKMQSDTLSMLRVVQIPPLEPLEGVTSSPSKQTLAPPPPTATCVLLPLQHTAPAATTLDGSPIRLQTLGEPINNNNNNNTVNNNILNNNKVMTKMYKKIQPATPEMAKCKRKISFVGQQQSGGRLYPSGGTTCTRKASSVARRNERERNRVKQVNQGFERLRQHVPNGARNKKMSKVETLRSALEYIKYMQDLLEQTDPANSAPQATQPQQSGHNQALPHGHMVHHHAQQPTHMDIGSENLSPSHSVESSLPSPSGYSTDGSSLGSSMEPSSIQMPGAIDMEQPPLSPEENELLDLATFWLMQSS